MLKTFYTIILKLIINRNINILPKYITNTLIIYEDANVFYEFEKHFINRLKLFAVEKLENKHAIKLL